MQRWPGRAAGAAGAGDNTGALVDPGTGTAAAAAATAAAAAAAAAAASVVAPVEPVAQFEGGAGNRRRRKNGRGGRSPEGGVASPGGVGVSGAAPGTATGRGQRGNASKARVFPAPAPPERMETVLQLRALARGASELASGRAVESLAVAAFTGGRIRRERKWQEHQAEAARANQQHFKRELLRAQSARQRSAVLGNMTS